MIDPRPILDELDRMHHRPLWERLTDRFEWLTEGGWFWILWLSVAFACGFCLGWW